MSTGPSRTVQRKVESGLSEEQRITALERDADVTDDNYSRLDKKISKLYVTSVSILVSVTTATILLALNLIVRSA